MKTITLSRKTHKTTTIEIMYRNEHSPGDESGWTHIGVIHSFIINSVIVSPDSKVGITPHEISSG